MSISVDLNITLINVPLPRVLTSTLLQGNVAGMTYFIGESYLYTQHIIFLWFFIFFLCPLQIYFSLLRIRTRGWTQAFLFLQINISEQVKY